MAVKVPGAEMRAHEQLITETLQSVRRLLGMEVAFVSEFLRGERIFRYLDADAHNCPIEVGDADPLEQTFCQRVVDGRLPPMMVDAQLNAEALSLPVTRALPVGGHVGVPVSLPDGRLFGTFCCFSRHAMLRLDERDLGTMQLVAELDRKSVV